jgi:hypothetical protein
VKEIDPLFKRFAQRQASLYQELAALREHYLARLKQIRRNGFQRRGRSGPQGNH